MRLLATSLLLISSMTIGWAQGEKPKPSPNAAFGLRPGMTLPQLKAIAPLVRGDVPGTYVVESLPAGDQSRFKGYMLWVGPKQGLCRVMAVGATIVTASNGEDLLAKYGALEDIITSKYGASLGKVDDLNPKSQWKANDEWMMSLKSNDRTLVSIWNFADGSRIGVIVSADSDHEGSVGLDYQFRNYGVCQREIEAAIY